MWLVKNHLRHILEPFWDHFLIMLEWFWDHFAIISGICWDHFGIILKSFWNHIVSILGPFWNQFGNILGSFWDYFGIILGSFQGHFGITGDHIRIILDNPIPTLISFFGFGLEINLMLATLKILWLSQTDNDTNNCKMLSIDHWPINAIHQQKMQQRIQQIPNSIKNS